MNLLSFTWSSRVWIFDTDFNFSSSILWIVLYLSVFTIAHSSSFSLRSFSRAVCLAETCFLRSKFSRSDFLWVSFVARASDFSLLVSRFARTSSLVRTWLSLTRDLLIGSEALLFVCFSRRAFVYLQLSQSPLGPLACETVPSCLNLRVDGFFVILVFVDEPVPALLSGLLPWILLLAFSVIAAAFSCSFIICSLLSLNSSRNPSSSFSKVWTLSFSSTFLWVNPSFSLYTSVNYPVLSRCSFSSTSLSSSILRITSTYCSKFFLCSSSTLSW